MFSRDPKGSAPLRVAAKRRICMEGPVSDWHKMAAAEVLRQLGTDPARVNHFCEGYKMFFREALPELTRMAEYIRHGQMPPLRPPRRQAGTVVEKIASAGPGLAGPAGPQGGAGGRNDPCPCGSGRKFKNCCGRK